MSATDWKQYEAKAREVAMSLPPSDFGSHRAIVAFAKTLAEAVEAEREACIQCCKIAQGAAEMTYGVAEAVGARMAERRIRARAANAA